jgi:hypothetical protein
LQNPSPHVSSLIANAPERDGVKRKAEFSVIASLMHEWVWQQCPMGQSCWSGQECLSSVCAMARFIPTQAWMDCTPAIMKKASVQTTHNCLRKKTIGKMDRRCLNDCQTSWCRKFGTPDSFCGSLSGLMFMRQAQVLE